MRLKKLKNAINEYIGLYKYMGFPSHNRCWRRQMKEDGKSRKQP